MKQLICVLALLSPALGQSTGAALIALFNGVPTGGCRSDSRTLALNMATGSLYSCVSGGWMMVGMGGGGAGTVTSFSAGNASPFFTTSVTTPTTTPALSFQPYTAPNNTMLGNTSGSSAVPTWIPIPSPGGAGSVTSFSSGNLSPLFTTSVATATTTPALSFSLSNAPANTMLGNSSSSSAPPSWIAIPSGGGGTNPLNGCQTATAGNLTCDNSMAVTTGSPGVLGLAFSSAGLPSPPATAKAELTANAQGEPYWSNGNSTAFEPLATTSDVTTAISNATSGFLSASAFANCNMMGWSSQNSASTCADLQPNIVSTTNYTIGPTDINHVIRYSDAGTMILPAPGGGLINPFIFWVDSACAADITLQPGAGALINNGTTPVQIGGCGWAMVWADPNQTNWHAQIYRPPGGVLFID